MHSVSQQLHSHLVVPTGRAFVSYTTYLHVTCRSSSSLQLTILPNSTLYVLLNDSFVDVDDNDEKCTILSVTNDDAIGVGIIITDTVIVYLHHHAHIVTCQCQCQYEVYSASFTKRT